MTIICDLIGVTLVKFSNAANINFKRCIQAKKNSFLESILCIPFIYITASDGYPTRFESKFEIYLTTIFPDFTQPTSHLL